MATERDPIEVIDAIEAQLPEGEHEILKGVLGQIRHDACFVAPECMRNVWLGIALALSDYLPRDIANAPTWVKKIANIVQGKEVWPIE
jgi:hypothetical protein